MFPTSKGPQRPASLLAFQQGWVSAGSEGLLDSFPVMPQNREWFSEPLSPTMGPFPQHGTWMSRERGLSPESLKGGGRRCLNLGVGI